MNTEKLLRKFSSYGQRVSVHQYDSLSLSPLLPQAIWKMRISHAKCEHSIALFSKLRDRVCNAIVSPTTKGP